MPRLDLRPVKGGAAAARRLTLRPATETALRSNKRFTVIAGSLKHAYDYV